LCLSEDECCPDLSGSPFDDWQSVYDLFQTERSDVARTAGSDVKLQTVCRRTRSNFLLLCQRHRGGVSFFSGQRSHGDDHLSTYTRRGAVARGEYGLCVLKEWSVISGQWSVFMIESQCA